MDSTSEKTCLDEISNLVLDASQKVTLKSISNNWNVSNDVAKDVLEKWLEQNKRKVAKEFLVSGINTNGQFRLAVVSEDKKDALEEKWQKFKSFLYSVELKTSSKSLNLPDTDPIKVKKILISKTASRDLHIPAIVTIKEELATSKKQETKPKTPFGMMKPAAKVADKKPEAKKEIVEKSKAKTPEKKAEPPKKIVKEAKSSPEDSKPASKAPAGKKVQLKNQKPVKAGSISSFFSSKPGTSKAAAEKPKEQKKEVVEAVDDDVEMVEVDLKVKESKAVQVKKAKEPKVVKDEKAKEAKSKKRSLTPEPVAEVEVKKKKPAAKKIKMKDPPNKNKRSRIRVMEDSSDSEEEAKQVEDEPDSKFIKFDREFTPEVGSSPEATPEKKPEVGMAKNKAKRWVTKRYQTEEGFMRTERVQEEYSASEGENDENKKKNSPVTQKTSPAIKKKTPVSGRKSSEKKKKPAEAAKAAPAAKNKQGNIMSFFHKK